jgi:allantoinase
MIINEAGSPRSRGDDLVLRSRRVVLPEGERPASVRVRDGRIVAIEPYERELYRGLERDRSGDGTGSVELGDAVLLPGLVDTHVHVNEPGRTEWEGFATATRAAAAGGVTTIIDMPLNSVPAVVSVAALEVKRRAATGQCFVDVGFWGGAVPGNEAHLPELYDAGVFGFKCFLIDSGVAEFPPLDPAGLASALAAVGALFVVHAEDPASVAVVPPSVRFADFVASRPRVAENTAVARVLEAARHVGGRVHIAHLSSAEALPVLRAARDDGVRVTTETCPHYLSLVADEVPDGATEYKCCPPIRDAANQDALWAGLADGVIDCVVSDHSPCTPQLKAGDFAAAWGGIASVQLGLPVVWTQARRRGYELSDVVGWMARGPADLAGLEAKGRIAVGRDADLVAFAPDEAFVVEPGMLRQRHPTTPYAGRRLTGVVRTTWLRGRPVDETPRGRQLTRD